MASKDDRSLFRQAVGEVRPVKAKPRAHAPRESLLPDEYAALREIAQGVKSMDDALEPGEQESFVRAGMTREALRRLRRGHWVVQDEIDMHGLTSSQAREAVAAFLDAALRRGVRCVRIVHGKGLRSPNREPVLKTRLRAWLPTHREVLAFCQAPPRNGGAGAMLVLLSARK